VKSYNVFHYLVFHTKVTNVEAESMEEAIAKSQDEVWEEAHAVARFSGFEFAECQHGALVDIVGDENFLHSKYFNETEVLNAEDAWYKKEKANGTRN
jgi:hypothetical protein